jgi:hypothetical protein
MEFPSCEACNDGSRDQDVLAAMLARMGPDTELRNRDGRLPGLVRKVNSRFPGLLREMMPSSIEARRANRRIGLTPPVGGTHQDTHVVKIPEKIREAVRVLASKLAKGLFYMEMGQIFPGQGCLLFRWFTNSHVIRDGGPVLFELLNQLAGKAPVLRRAGRDLVDQFEYKLSTAESERLFVLQAHFPGSFGFVVFGSATPGHLESIAAALLEQTGRAALETLQGNSPS